MTIRFIKAWNSYSPDDVATLDAGVETRLKSAGIARDSAEVDGPFLGVGNGVAGVVVSEDAPSDADGRPDGTIYIQTA